MKKLIFVLLLLAGPALAKTTSGSGPPTGNVSCETAGEEQYIDSSTNTMYMCVQPGSKTTTVWKQVSGEAGGSGGLQLQATDCTLLTSAVDGDMCFEKDANQIWVCKTTGGVGTCDVATEWVRATPGSVINLPASGDIAAIVNAAPEYTRFFMVPNAVYDLTTWSTGLNLKTGDVFDGQNATITGAKDFTAGTNCDGGAWTQPVGTYWRCATAGKRVIVTDNNDPGSCQDIYSGAPPAGLGAAGDFCRHLILWVGPNLKIDKSTADFSEVAVNQWHTLLFQNFFSGAATNESSAFMDGNNAANEFFRPCAYFGYGTSAYNANGLCLGADAGQERIDMWQDPTNISVVMNHGYGTGNTNHVYAFRMGNAPFSGARSNNITVKNVTVQFLASTMQNNGAIHTGRCDNCVIDNVTVRFNQGNGIACFESKNLEVKNSRLVANSNDGYQGCWQNSPSGVVDPADGEKFHDNYLARNGFGAFHNQYSPGNAKLAGATNGRIYNNKFVDPGKFGSLRAACVGAPCATQYGENVENLWIDSNYAGWIIENNFIARGQISGIYIEVSCNGIIRNNVIEHNNFGIKLNGSHDILIDGNRIARSGWVGLNTQYAANRNNQNFTSAPFGGWQSPCPGGNLWDGHVLNVSVIWNQFIPHNNQSGSQTNLGNEVINTTVLYTHVDLDSSQTPGAGDSATSGFFFNYNCYEMFDFPSRQASAWTTQRWNSIAGRLYYTYERWRSVLGFDAAPGSGTITYEPGGCDSHRLLAQPHSVGDAY